MKTKPQYVEGRSAKAEAPPRARSRRIEVRASGVHGKGVYALQPIDAGETIIEYKGERITWPEALRRHPHDPSDPFHTFYFHVDEEHVIDGARQGNSARWINHSCNPNCEAEDDGGRIFIKALRKVKAGQELFFDYGLVLDERHTPKVKKQYECRCGSAKCRGTMLAPKRRPLAAVESGRKPKAGVEANKPKNPRRRSASAPQADGRSAEAARR